MGYCNQRAVFIGLGIGNRNVFSTDRFFVFRRVGLVGKLLTFVRFFALLLVFAKRPLGMLKLSKGRSLSKNTTNAHHNCDKWVRNPIRYVMWSVFKLIDDKQVYDSNEICQWIPKRSYCILLEVLALLHRREYEETDTLPHYFGVVRWFRWGKMWRHGAKRERKFGFRADIAWGRRWIQTRIFFEGC